MAGIGDWIMANRERADRRDSAMSALSLLQAGGYGANQAPASDPSVDPAGEQSQSGMDQAEAAGKKADAIRSVMTAYNPDPQAKTALRAMSVGQLEGLLRGYALKSTMEERQALAADRRAQEQQRLQLARDDQSIGDFTREFYNAPSVAKLAASGYGDYAGEQSVSGPAATEPVPPSQMDRFKYASSKVPVSGRAVPRLLQTLGMSPAGDSDAGKLTFEEDPVTGYRFAKLGKTMQTSGFNPSKTTPQPVPHYDENDNLTGMSEFDPKKGWTMKSLKDTSLKRARLEDGTEISGFVTDASGRLHDVRSGLEKKGTPGITPPAPPTKAMSSVKTQKDFDALPSGTIYIGKDGKRYQKL